MSLKFVGAERRGTIDNLLSRFEQIRLEGVPQVLCLTGEPGIGKTRLVQEFYERLAAEHQPQPRYWPPSLLDDPTADVLSRRKVIAPGAFTIPAHAKPSWIWWGISCQLDLSGKPVRSMRLAKGQFDAHVEYLSKRATAEDEQWQRWSKNLKTCVDVVGLATNPLSVLPTALGIIKNTAQVFAENRDHQAVIESDRAVDTAALSLEENDEMAAAVARVGSDDLPMIIAIDDAHWADPTMVRFVNALAQYRDAPIMILATAYDHEIRRQQEEQRTGSFGAWLRPAEAQGKAVVGRLERLATSDLSEMVLSVAPRTPEAKAIALARKADGLPLLLALLLELEIVRRDIKPDDSIDIDPDELAVPSGIQAVYQELWYGLPTDVRTALILAALQGPHFVPESIADVAAKLGVIEAVDGLAQAASTYRWITEIEPGLGFFVEPRRFDTAISRQPDVFSDDDVDKAAQALAAHLIATRRTDAWPERSLTSRMLALRLLLRLHKEGAELPTAEVKAAAQELLALIPGDESAERVDLRSLLVDVQNEAGDDPTDDARSGLLAELVNSGDSELVKQHRDVLNAMPVTSPQDLELISAAKKLSKSLAAGSDAPEANLIPYRSWVAHPVGALTELEPSQIGDLIAAVVRCESPVTVGRVYRLLVDASPASRLGRNIRAALDRGVNSALRRRLIDRPGNDKRSDGDRRVLTVVNPPVAMVREPGPRTLDEIPPIELATFAWRLLPEFGDLDEVKTEIARRFGYSRRSDRINDILEDALRFLDPPDIG